MLKYRSSYPLFPDPNCRLYIWFPPFINIFGSAVENSQQTDKHSRAIIIGSIRKFTNQTKTVRSWVRLLYTPTMVTTCSIQDVISSRNIAPGLNNVCPFMSLFSWFWLSLIEMSPWSAQLNEGLSSVKDIGVLEGARLSPFPIVVVTKRRKQRNSYRRLLRHALILSSPPAPSCTCIQKWLPDS